jgi:hypothetical protein
VFIAITFWHVQVHFVYSLLTAIDEGYTLVVAPGSHGNLSCESLGREYRTLAQETLIELVLQPGQSAIMHPRLLHAGSRSPKLGDVNFNDPSHPALQPAPSTHPNSPGGVFVSANVILCTKAMAAWWRQYGGVDAPNGVRNLILKPPSDAVFASASFLTLSPTKDLVSRLFTIAPQRSMALSAKHSANAAPPAGHAPVDLMAKLAAPKTAAPKTASSKTVQRDPTY